MTEQKKHISYVTADGTETSKSAEDILVRLCTAVKIIRLYEPNNQLFLQQADVIFQFLDNSLRIEGESVFSLWQNTLFYNKEKLKFAFYNYHIFKFVISEFKHKEIGAISFDQGLTKEEMRQFLVQFAAKDDRKTRIAFEDFVKRLKNIGIPHVKLEKISPQELRSSREERAVKDYFLSIMHLGDLFQKEHDHKKINLNITRRLMQSLVKNITENEPFLQGLTTIKNYDEYTLNHSVNVCVLSMALGNRLGLDKKEMVDLGICAFFHDIGKLDTPVEILNKPGKLTDEEFKIIQKHPYQGAGKLVQMDDFNQLPLRAIHVSMEHHIKENFTGYPIYFKKKSVNLYSKIVKIVDVFDAITTQRIYRKKAFTRDKALSLMAKNSGDEFHPLLFKIFANMMSGYPVGSLVLLHTGEMGVVTEVNPDPTQFHRPRVKLITDPERNKIDGMTVDTAEMDPDSGKYRREIVKTLDPEKYNIRVADYFLAQAESLF
jgi:HD-GYP domain-containing protein (c-di-GMP phosphodiesterase class II)